MMTNPEINEAVARKLGLTPRSCENAHTYMKESGDNNYHSCSSTIPAYSTSIEAAWEIVESLHPQHGVDLSQHLQPPYGWSCRMWTAMTEEPDFIVRADTAPLAICEAFLKLP